MARMLCFLLAMTGMTTMSPSLQAFSFPLWLDSPSRSNPHDPKSPQFQAPASSPFLPTFTMPATPSLGTFTPTPTPSPTMTVTPSGGHGALITDFSQPLTVTAWGGGLLTNVDSNGSVMNPSPWLPGSATAGAGCINGTVIADAPPYGWSEFIFELAPGGSNPSANPMAVVNVDPYAPGQGLQFNYKSGHSGVTYKIRLINPVSYADRGYYEYSFTPRGDNTWRNLTVFFPGSPNQPQFAQPAGSAPKGWVADNAHSIGAVLFQVMQSPSASTTYDLCIDDLSFVDSPIPTPTQTPSSLHGGTVVDFEDNSAKTRWTQDGATYGDIVVNTGPGSSGGPNPWVAGSATAGGASASAFGGCYSGVNNDWNEFLFELAPGGKDPSSNPLAMTDVQPFAPSGSFKFDYRVDPGGENKAWLVIFVSPVTFHGGGANKNYYRFDFTTANDNNWHSLTAYLPDSVNTPRFYQAASPSPQYSWNAPDLARRVGSIIFSSPSGAFSLCLDNIRFE